MSWKQAGRILSGAPSISDRKFIRGDVAGSSTSTENPVINNNSRLVDRYKPNPSGQGAFQREHQLFSRYGPRVSYKEERKTEWDVLKENHRFIRDDEEPGEVSWEERLARAYESKLFKEFALIDLKHYKSKRLALRWRTAPEVVEGIGEETCGSLRCKHHQPPNLQSEAGSESGRNSASGSGSEFSDHGLGNHKRRKRNEHHRRRKEVRLRSFELPFAYLEAGERREALVKVRLCVRCERKLVWKPSKEVEIDVGGGEDKEKEKARGRDDEKGRRLGSKSDRRERENEDNRRSRDRAREKQSDRRGKGEDRGFESEKGRQGKLKNVNEHRSRPGDRDDNVLEKGGGRHNAGRRVGWDDVSRSNRDESRQGRESDSQGDHENQARTDKPQRTESYERHERQLRHERPRSRSPAQSQSPAPGQAQSISPDRPPSSQIKIDRARVRRSTHDDQRLTND